MDAHHYDDLRQAAAKELKPEVTANRKTPTLQKLRSDTVWDAAKH